MANAGLDDSQLGVNDVAVIYCVDVVLYDLHILSVQLGRLPDLLVDQSLCLFFSHSVEHALCQLGQGR